MLKKIITTSVLLTLISATVCVQGATVTAPGKPLPVDGVTSQEATLFLNSAPNEPGNFETLSDISVETQTEEAVVSFSTDTSIHAVIEYGLTPEYDQTLSTEPQRMHTETLGNLTPCARYYYLVRAGDAFREGVFDTQCPVVKKALKKTVASTVKKIVPPVEKNIVTEEALVLNAAPEEIKNTVYASGNTEALEKAPEAPALPGPIAFGNDTVTPQDTKSQTPIALILFTLLSGSIVVFFALKKDKKWYQK